MFFVILEKRGDKYFTVTANEKEKEIKTVMDLYNNSDKYSIFQLNGNKLKPALVNGNDEYDFNGSDDSTMPIKLTTDKHEIYNHVNNKIFNVYSNGNYFFVRVDRFLNIQSGEEENYCNFYIKWPDNYLIIKSMNYDHNETEKSCTLTPFNYDDYFLQSDCCFAKNKFTFEIKSQVQGRFEVGEGHINSPSEQKLLKFYFDYSVFIISSGEKCLYADGNNKVEWKETDTPLLISRHGDYLKVHNKNLYLSMGPGKRIMLSPVPYSWRLSTR